MRVSRLRMRRRTDYSSAGCANFVVTDDLVLGQALIDSWARFDFCDQCFKSFPIDPAMSLAQAKFCQLRIDCKINSICNARAGPAGELANFDYGFAPLDMNAHRLS